MERDGVYSVEAMFPGSLICRHWLEDLMLDICKRLGIPATDLFPNDPELACMYENDSIGG